MLIHHQSPPADPSRVVVLGARGFIGRALVDALERDGITVLGFGRAELDLAADDAGDRLAGLLKPDDAVVMLAAVTPDKGKGIAPFLANIRAAASLCAALAKITPRHVIYFNSDAVYPMNAGLVNEDSCTRPSDLYGMMHLAREAMIEAATTAPVALLRPTLVYGAADTHNSYGPNRFRRMAHEDGKIVLFGNGKEMRDHIAVDDVIALAILVLRHRSAGVLNVATGWSISFADLAEKVAALFDKPIEIVRTPGQSPITHRHFDIAALRKAFPEFTLTSLDRGLANAHHKMLAQE